MDIISRQQAIDALDKHFESFIKRFGYDSYERADEKTKLVCDGLSEAEDVIIGLPSTNLAGTWQDCISRQDAIDAVIDELDMIDHVPQWVFDRLEGRLKNLPSAQPKMGKWEITNLGAVGVFDSCSECKRVVKHKAPFYNFCPNCGADMREE